MTGVALGHNGRIYVCYLFYGSGGNGAIFKVDPQTGNRTVVSDFSQGALQGKLYYGLAVDASSKLLANLQGATNGIVRVDPETDNRVLVTDINNLAQGPSVGGGINDLALDHFGQILISALGPETNIDHSVIVQVNPETGERKLVSDFTNPAQGPVAVLDASRSGLAETSGRILANSVFQPSGDSGLVSIDPETGYRTVFSDFGGGYLAGLGAVFKVTDQSLTAIWTFTGGSDGNFAQAPLIADEQGVFYGTTQYGGSLIYASGPAVALSSS